MAILEKHIVINNDNSKNAVSIFAEHTQLSNTVIKDAMQKGALWLTRGQQTKRLRRAKKNLQHGDQLSLYFNDEILAQQPPCADLIHDQKHYSVWYKPYGLYCQGSKWGDHCTINRVVEQQLNRPTFMVHRLDRATRGLILLAHSKQSAATLSALFKYRDIEKTYQAIIHGQLEANELTIDQSIEGKTAISHVRQLQYDDAKNQSLVEIKIDTGRKHQIRHHLAHLNHPILGDRLYGHAPNASDINLQLTSVSLIFFDEQSGENVSYTLPENKKLKL